MLKRKFLESVKGIELGIRITKHINDLFERSVTSSYKSCSEINEEFFNKNYRKKMRTFHGLVCSASN